MVSYKLSNLRCSGTILNRKPLKVRTLNRGVFAFQGGVWSQKNSATSPQVVKSSDRHTYEATNKCRTVAQKEQGLISIRPYYVPRKHSTCISTRSILLHSFNYVQLKTHLERVGMSLLVESHVKVPSTTDTESSFST